MSGTAHPRAVFTPMRPVRMFPPCVERFAVPPMSCVSMSPASVLTSTLYPRGTVIFELHPELRARRGRAGDLRRQRSVDLDACFSWPGPRGSSGRASAPPATPAHRFRCAPCSAPPAERLARSGTILTEPRSVVRRSVSPSLVGIDPLRSARHSRCGRLSGLGGLHGGGSMRACGQRSRARESPRRSSNVETIAATRNGPGGGSPKPVESIARSSLSAGAFVTFALQLRSESPCPRRRSLASRLLHVARADLPQRRGAAQPNIAVRIAPLQILRARERRAPQKNRPEARLPSVAGGSLAEPRSLLNEFAFERAHQQVHGLDAHAGIRVVPQRLQQSLAHRRLPRRNRAALPAPSMRTAAILVLARRRQAARGALARRRCALSAHPGNPAARPDRTARRWPPRRSARGARPRHPRFPTTTSGCSVRTCTCNVPGAASGAGAKLTPATAIFDRSSSVSRGAAITFTAWPLPSPEPSAAAAQGKPRRHLRAHAKPTKISAAALHAGRMRHPAAHPAKRHPVLRTGGAERSSSRSESSLRHCASRAPEGSSSSAGCDAAEKVV